MPPSKFPYWTLAALLALVVVADSTAATTLARDAHQLAVALRDAGPGDMIVMADGIWNDLILRWTRSGTAAAPITLRAENPGHVFIEGRSLLRLGGDHLVVQGVVFRHGRAASGAVIEFRVDDAHVANDSRLTECVIDRFNPTDRFAENAWIVLYGQRNRVDHCYLGGKLNGAPALIVQRHPQLPLRRQWSQRSRGEDGGSALVPVARQSLHPLAVRSDRVLLR